MALNDHILDKKKISELRKTATQARAAILKMTTLAGSGHPGGSMSTIDLLLTLYETANVDPESPRQEDRDIVVMSHGHVSPATYTALGIKGFFSLEDAISQFRLAGSIFEGHVEPDVPGIEWATGNLGQGLSAGIGFALANRIKKIDSNVFVFMGDGEQQKGQISEARRFACKYEINNLTAIIDYNKLQISGSITDVMPQNIRENFISDGWEVIEIDGHNFQEIYASFEEAKTIDKPVAILANTTMGKEIGFMEDKAKYHGKALSESQLEEALKELKEENDLEKFKKLREEFKPAATDEREPDNYIINRGENFLYDKPAGNREAWGNAIADLIEKNISGDIPFVVFDCDLAGSVKTTKFKEIAPKHFFEGGIMEHNTATIAGAMSKKGIQVFFADFGVFGIDETYNQHRLNDINNANLKIITTHVGLDVGEDGKTHQCLDYVGVMKNLYGFKIIIPGCPDQTDHIIRDIAAKEGNYSVSMGRSKLKPIFDENGERIFGKNYRFEYGKADLIRSGKSGAIFAMGTVLNRAVNVVDRLKKEGIDLTLYNISSPGEIDEEAVRRAAETNIIFTYEDHNINTGLGNSIAEKLLELKLTPDFIKFGVEDYGVSGAANDVFAFMNLDEESIYQRIKIKLGE